MKHSAISKTLLLYNNKIPLGLERNPDYKLYLKLFTDDLIFSVQREIIRKTLVDDGGTGKLRSYCRECLEAVLYADKYKGVVSIFLNTYTFNQQILVSETC